METDRHPVPLIRAFLSYNHLDKDLASRLGAAMRDAGIQCFNYAHDLALGDGIAAAVRRGISESEYCIVLLTARSVNSTWVRRELGLAHHLHQAQDARPQIVGVTCGLARPPLVELLDFEGVALPRDQSIDFADLNCLQMDELSHDALVERLRTLTPTLTWLSDPGVDRDFAGKVFDYYESFFPDPGERDSLPNIEDWLEEGLVENPTWDPWCEYFAALRLRQSPIGLAYLSFHPRSQWCGGSYFGIRQGWRDRDRAIRLLTLVLDRIGQEWPGAKGVLFEIAMVDIDLLERAAACDRLAVFPDQQALRSNLRSLARLRIYQQRGCRAMVRTDRRPVNVVQAALTKPLDESNERPMILMYKAIHPANPVSLDPDSVLQFWFEDFYGQSFDGSGAVEIAGYVEYVNRVKQRVLAEAHRHGFRLGIVEIPQSVRQLTSRAVKEGLVPRLEL